MFIRLILKFPSKQKCIISDVKREGMREQIVVRDRLVIGYKPKIFRIAAKNQVICISVYIHGQCHEGLGKRMAIIIRPR